MNSKDDRVISFLNRVCVDFGFCDSLHHTEKFLSQNCWEADNFVEELFACEDMDPGLEQRLFRQIKREFINYFGSSTCEE